MKISTTHTLGDESLQKAMKAIQVKNYQSCYDLVLESLDKGVSSKFEPFAINWRGTFRFLMGDSEGALTDFESVLSLSPTYTDAIIKKASLSVERMDMEGTKALFEEAERIDSQDPDFYYHRGNFELS